VSIDDLIQVVGFDPSIDGSVLDHFDADATSAIPETAGGSHVNAVAETAGFDVVFELLT